MIHGAWLLLIVPINLFLIALVGTAAEAYGRKQALRALVKAGNIEGAQIVERIL